MTIRMKLLMAVAAAALAGSPAFADHHGGKGKGHGRHHGSIEKMDTDGDGVITREEAQAARKAHMMKADANGDGAVTLEELKAYRDKMREERRENRAERRFKRMDANGDGKITADEIDAMKMHRFDRIDANNDGKITKEEIEAHKAKMKERRGKHRHHGGDGGGKDGQ
jgi:Ca2+-binding EF-hand superfamily protein